VADLPNTERSKIQRNVLRERKEWLRRNGAGLDV
jgi:acyl-coenzyme A synthetase/AMP-(fatty) acid ligase